MMAQKCRQWRQLMEPYARLRAGPHILRYGCGGHVGP